MPNSWWWADRLNYALSQLQFKQDFTGAMGIPASLAIDTLMRNVIKGQPHGHTEYDPKGYYAVGTVSQRIGHTPIEDGWRTSIVDEDNDLKMRVSNVSQHVEAVIRGAGLYGKRGEKYPIPKLAPFVFFWWGRPQRWQPANREPGYYKFSVVSHPGQRANPFFVDAIEESRPGMAKNIGSGIAGWIRDTMWRAGLREQ